MGFFSRFFRNDAGPSQPAVAPALLDPGEVDALVQLVRLACGHLPAERFEPIATALRAAVALHGDAAEALVRAFEDEETDRSAEYLVACEPGRLHEALDTLAAHLAARGGGTQLPAGVTAPPGGSVAHALLAYGGVLQGRGLVPLYLDVEADCYYLLAVPADAHDRALGLAETCALALLGREGFRQREVES